MIRKYIALSIFILFANIGFSQVKISKTTKKTDTAVSDVPVYEYEKTALGVGLGNEYSLIGGHFLLYIHENIGLMFGAGYVYTDMGFNGGIKIRYTKKKLKSRVQIYTFGQYGYLSWIKVTNNPSFNKIFYGFTAGIGTDIRFNKLDGNYLSLSLSYNFKTKETIAKMEDYAAKNSIHIFSEEIAIPVLGISIGYHFVE